MKVDTFSQNKLYSSEILSILLQGSSTVGQEAIQKCDGIKQLIKLIAVSHLSHFFLISTTYSMNTILIYQHVVIHELQIALDVRTYSSLNAQSSALCLSFARCFLFSFAHIVCVL